MVKHFVNYGGGVNSTAILALMCNRKLDFIDEELFIAFADTGGETEETLEYVKYMQEIMNGYGYNLRIVKSREGGLWDYCTDKKILPMRRLRWCTDRWKRKPLTDFRMEFLEDKNEEHRIVLGIDYGERQRASRWSNDTTSLFPLIDLEMNRKDCIDVIKKIGWKVPKKSGCWFCPYAKPKEFGLLKKNKPELFKKLCKLEKKTLERLKTFKQKGWFNEKYPLDELVKRKCPELAEGQQSLHLSMVYGTPQRPKESQTRQ